MSNLGVAIIGAGRRSGMMFNFLQRNSEYGFVTGIYDIIPQKGRYLIDRYQAKDAVLYNSLQEAVDDKRVNAVFISTTDSEHVAPVTSALKAGKHVYCEKPLAINLEDCDKIIKVAKKAKKVFYLGKNLRHSPVYVKMYEILQDGRLGKLLTIEASEYYFGGRTYFRRWNRLKKYGGGLWITKACHDFDILNWFAGGKPVKVFAASNLSYYKPIEGVGPNCRNCATKKTCPDYYDINNPGESNWLQEWDELGKISEEATNKPRDLCLYNSEKDTFDNGVAAVEYDNDIRAVYTLNIVSTRDTRQLRLVGTAGSAEADMETGSVVCYQRYSRKKETFDLTAQMNSTHGGADDQVLGDFFNCCINDKTPKSSWPQGRLALQVGLAARESSEKQTIVFL